jgi:hypothetical protein
MFILIVFLSSKIEYIIDGFPPFLILKKYKVGIVTPEIIIRYHHTNLMIIKI